MPDRYATVDIPNRLEQNPDPWSGLMCHLYSLSNRREKLDRLLALEQPADEEKD